MASTDGKEVEVPPRGEEDEEKRQEKLDRRKEDLKKAVLGSGEAVPSLYGRTPPAGRATALAALAAVPIVMGPKNLREIHIGGIIPEWRPIVIQSFLEEAMRQVGMIKTGDPPPIIGVRTNGWFAFAECRSPEIATKLLDLDRIKFKNRFLRLNRPTTYNGPHDTSRKCWEDVVRDYQLRKPATKVLRFANMLSEDDIASETALKEVEEDTLDECNKIGKVVSVVVPCKTAEDKEERSGRLPCVYVEFEHEDGARMAQSILGSRLFDGHKVQADFYDEKKFEAQIFDPPTESSAECLSVPPAVTPTTNGPMTSGSTAASTEENAEGVTELEKKTEQNKPEEVDKLKEELTGEEQEQEIEGKEVLSHDGEEQEEEIVVRNSNKED